MKRVVSLIGYLLVFTGCSLEAWLIYSILSQSYEANYMETVRFHLSRFKIVITAPATDIVSKPFIQVKGCFPEEIETVTYEITNAVTKAGQGQGQGYVTGQFFDQAKADRMRREALRNRFTLGKPNPLESLGSAYSTNYFQLYDIFLAKGKNCITIHVKARNGKSYTTTRLYTLDYSQSKKPPVLTMIWPKDGEKIAGDNFTLSAQVNDETAAIRATIKNDRRPEYCTSALVTRDGSVWVNDLPLDRGTNEVTLIATDAAGNTSTNRLHVIRSAVSVTMQPLAADQMNKPFVTVKGTVSDTNCRVEINGIAATVQKDGTWEAHRVHVSPTGTAVFNVSLFDNSPTNHEAR